MLYPVLHRLERQGLIESVWRTADSGRRRKYYAITERGRARVEQARRHWQLVDQTLRRAWSRTQEMPT
ncbi:MAG: hypothetical protein Kow0020_13940 [Wenzhouxiangellaceae bacterium]